MQILHSYPIVFHLSKLGFVYFDVDGISFLVQTTQWRSVGYNDRGANFAEKTM